MMENTVHRLNSENKSIDQMCSLGCFSTSKDLFKCSNSLIERRSLTLISGVFF